MVNDEGAGEGEPTSEDEAVGRLLTLRVHLFQAPELMRNGMSVSVTAKAKAKAV